LPSDVVAWKQLQDAQGRLFYAIRANLARHGMHGVLRSGRRLGVETETITLFPTRPSIPSQVAGRFARLDDVRDVIETCAPVDETYYRPLIAALQRVITIKPKRKGSM